MTPRVPRRETGGGAKQRERDALVGCPFVQAKLRIGQADDPLSARRISRPTRRSPVPVFRL